MKKATFAVFLLFFHLFSFQALAQEGDIRIAGAKSGFPVALPSMCAEGAAKIASEKIIDLIKSNLELSGYFEIVKERAYIDENVSCKEDKDISFADWTVIGTEGLVKGELKIVDEGNSISSKLYLLDVIQKRAVIGKLYQADVNDYRKIANRFSNEILKYFTGKEGPFGTKVAYVGKSGRFKELFVSNLDGTDKKRLTRDKGIVVAPSWSNNGEEIVYTSYVTRRPELYMVSPDGKGRKRITKRHGMELGAEFTRGDRTIISSASDGGYSNLVEFSRSGKLIRHITRNRGIDISPSLSPDGSMIAFCSNRGGGPQIYTMTSRGRGVERLSYTGSPYCTSPSWSPDGKRIAFVCRNKGNQLYVANSAGGQATQLTYFGNNEDPSWSPDSRYLLYSSDFGRRRRKNLAIISLQTANPKQLTFGKDEKGQPSWSPTIVD